jgi:Flp pilus assembly protein TadG
MNNKGQSLVLFVLVIPITFMVLLMVYDIGNMVLLKNELNDINYLVVDYGIDVMALDGKEEKVRELINKNKNDIDNIEITFEDDKVYVTLEDSVNMTAINNIKIFKIKSSYVGYIDNGEKIIERNK